MTLSLFRLRGALSASVLRCSTAALCLTLTGAVRAQQTDVPIAFAATHIYNPFNATLDLASPSLAGSDSNPAALVADNALPDAPLPQIRKQSTPTPSEGPEALHIAKLHAKYIPEGWKAQPLGVRGKIVVGAADLYSIDNFLAIFASAGYAHISNGQPNYGSDKKAFGQRLGAAAIRETSQGVFTDMVFSPLLHEDPRYYQKGVGHSFVNRTWYAITRPLVTRTDGGRPTVNASLLLGYAGAAALTPTFYPQINRNFHDTAATYGGSIGGAALGFFVSEFSDDVLQAIHLKRAP